MTEPTQAPGAGSIVRYFDGHNSGFLLVHATSTREQLRREQRSTSLDYGDDAEWIDVIDIDGWVFRPDHDGARWLAGIPHVEDPDVDVEREPYWRHP